MSISKLVLGLVVLVTGLFANLSVLAFEGDTYNWANESLYIETDKFFTFFRRVFGSLLKVFH